MRNYAEASLKLDAEAKIVEDSKCCLKVNAVISRAGVYDYDDGAALKSKMELLKAVPSARYAKLVMGAHPDTLVVMQQKEIRGGIEKPFWDRNRMRATLCFDKKLTPGAFLERVRQAARGGKPLNNSIGFYYRADWTPGEALDVNTGKKRTYDYAMRDIMIDHVAVGDFKGRCRAPNCGIGVGIDTVFRRLSFQTDKVVQRGNRWCVIHCHGAKEGEAIKCFSGPDAKSQAEAMHRAIQARKSSGADLFLAVAALVDVDALSNADYNILFETTVGKPPKGWCGQCESRASAFAAEPGAFCHWLWTRGPAKLKEGFGLSNVLTDIGGNEVSEAEKTDEAYATCVKEKMAGGLSKEEAEEECKGLKPVGEAAEEGEEEPPELTPWQKCLKKHTDKGEDMDAAVKACEAEGIAKTDAEETEAQAFERCVTGKMEIDGMTREEAVEACTPKIDQGVPEKTVETPAEGQEELPTPLEQCVAARMESHGESEETATGWCKDEIAGLHEPAEKIVDRVTGLQAKARKLDDAGS